MSYQSQVPTMAKISGVGHYSPEKILTNEDLEKMVDTNDECRTKKSIKSYGPGIH